MIGTMLIKPYMRIRTPNNILFIKQETGTSTLDFLKVIDNNNELGDEVRYYKYEVAGLSLKLVDSISKLSEKMAYKYRDILSEPAGYVHLTLTFSTTPILLTVSNVISSVISRVHGLFSELSRSDKRNFIKEIVDDIIGKYIILLVNEEPLIYSSVLSACSEDEKIVEKISPLEAGLVEVIDTPTMTLSYSMINGDTRQTLNLNVQQLVLNNRVEDLVRNGMEEAKKYNEKPFLYKLTVAAGLLEKTIRDLAIRTCRHHSGKKLQNCVSDVVSYVISAIAVSINENRDSIVARISREIEKHSMTM